MKVEHKSHTTILKDTEGNISEFIQKLTNQYDEFKERNLIVDVSHDSTADVKALKDFSELSKKHKKARKSFVIVAENIDFNKIPASILVVPTLQEAHDMIEMEEIERDLGF